MKNELPNDLPPLPEPPTGHRWVYRGIGWHSTIHVANFAWWPDGLNRMSRWRLSSNDVACGNPTIHYAEAVPIQPADPLAEALEAIAKVPGNLPDDRLESKTGANDAVQRGIMVTTMRAIATKALSAHRARKG